MKENRMKEVLENIARRAVPEDVNLVPAITARLQRKFFMTTLRTKPVLMILLVLLALTLLSGVVYAIGKATGYIPGIGLVNQDMPLRVLAEPVSVTREGITLTVEQVMLSADKTVLVYKLEGISADAFVNEGSGDGSSSSAFSSSLNLEGTPEVTYTNGGNVTQCVADERLLLPDGSTLHVNGGEGSGWLSGFERRFEYAPISADVTDAVFIVSCIDGTALGKLSENWKVQLKFVPAPAEMTVLPIVEVTSSALSASQSAITVEQVIETDEGYVLIGKFRLFGYPSYVDPNGFQTNWIKFTDANGKLVEAFSANDMQFENKLAGEFPWAYEIQGKQHTWPLTITIDTIYAYFLGETTQFEFDTGDNPQVGQTWVLNPGVQIAGYEIKEVSIKHTDTGYEFLFKNNPDVQLFFPEIMGYTISRSGGGSDGFGRGEVHYKLEYKGEPPSGKLIVKISDLLADIHGPWQVQWSPENSLPIP